MKVIELFSGIGAQAMALKELSIEFESTMCEIDKHAIKSYQAIHGLTPNLGNICTLEHLPVADMVTYSFPCQDLSIASGTQKGMEEGSGTRSALVWEVGRLLKDAKERGTLPQYLLMENVPAVINKKNISEFNRWIQTLTDLGYTSEYAIMNAKDYGVPQNRKRCFMVSALGGKHFNFPEPCPDGRVLRDVLEEDVDEKYFLSDEKIINYERHKVRQEGKGYGHGWVPVNPTESVANTVTAKKDHYPGNFVVVEGDFKESQAEIRAIVAGDLNNPNTFDCCNRVHSPEGLAPTVPTSAGGGHMPKIEVIEWPSNTKKGYMEAREGDGLVMARPTKARGTVQCQMSPTLMGTKGCDSGVVIYDKSEEMPDIDDGDVLAMLTPGREHKRQQGRRYKDDGTAFTITTQDRHGIATQEGGRLRIRYLTERETWRLQGFPDWAFEAARDAGTSSTQLYKQAGNSIAVPCLKAIFKGMFIDNTWRD